MLSTKVGYGMDGLEDWTYECILAGVDAARALLRCRELGKIRVAAYSGDDEALRIAIGSGAFGSVQASVSLCDQQALDVLPGATARGLGTIAKRSLAGRPWDSSVQPVDAAQQEYHRRFAALRAAGLDLAAADLDGVALRFSAYAPGVDCVIVGGADARHLQKNIAAVSAGPLRPEQLALIHGAFSRAATNWRGLI